MENTRGRGAIYETKKKTKSTLLADNTRGLRTKKKQKKTKRFCSTHSRGGGETILYGRKDRMSKTENSI